MNEQMMLNGQQAVEEPEQLCIEEFQTEKKSPPPAELVVTMKDAFIYDMLLYHMYSTFGGFCMNLAGLTAMALGGLRYYFGQHSLNAAFGYIILGVFIVAFTPLNLKLRAKNTMKEEKYSGAICYRFSDSGIEETLCTGRMNHYSWSEVEKAVNTPKTIAFYMTGGARVLVFPKEDFDNVTFRDTMWFLSHHVVMGKIYIH